MKKQLIILALALSANTAHATLPTLEQLNTANVVISSSNTGNNALSTISDGNGGFLNGAITNASSNVDISSVVNNKNITNSFNVVGAGTSFGFTDTVNTLSSSVNVAGSGTYATGQLKHNEMNTSSWQNIGNVTTLGNITNGTGTLVGLSKADISSTLVNGTLTNITNLQGISIGLVNGINNAGLNVSSTLSALQ